MFISLASYHVKFCPFASQLGLSVRKLSNVVRRHTPRGLKQSDLKTRCRHRMPVMSVMSVTHTQLTPSQAARSHRSSLRFLSLEAVCLRDQHLYPRHFTLTISTLHRTTGQCHNTLSIQLAKKIQHVSMIHDEFLTILDTKSHQNTDAKKISTKHQNDKKNPRPTHFLGQKHGLPFVWNITSFHCHFSERRRGSPSVSVVSVRRKRPRSALRLTVRNGK